MRGIGVTQMIQELKMVKLLLAENTLEDVYKSMLNNPQFIQFIKENEHKTTEEIMMDYDIKLLR